MLGLASRAPVPVELDGFFEQEVSIRWAVMQALKVGRALEGECGVVCEALLGSPFAGPVVQDACARILALQSCSLG